MSISMKNYLYRIMEIKIWLLSFFNQRTCAKSKYTTNKNQTSSREIGKDYFDDYPVGYDDYIKDMEANGTETNRMDIEIWGPADNGLMTIYGKSSKKKQSECS